eukprot:gb/GEZN01003111.1/.p1 GENE.gb/GEZN01003111.1/~~gb/GEZN01003111.1/.p1  ORF type:complete len:725 (-),score=112.37 gb/GEZN01003111.1/:59-2233(-)
MPSAPPLKKAKLMTSQESYDYDLIVVGGGSGGMNAAKEAMRVKPGLKVALFDFVKPSPAGTQWGLGGTCVNVGCIPKKLMHYSGLLGHSFEQAKEMGWSLNAEEVPHSWETMAGTIQSYIGSLNWSYKKQLNGAGVKYIHAYASFVDAHTVEYTERKKTHRITGQYFLVCTGGRPNYGSYPGKELCISSDDLFWLQKSPGKTLCVGGGYISLECANFLHDTKQGEVSVIVRSQPMRKFDSQVGGQIGELMERRGIRFIFPADIVNIRAVKAPTPDSPPLEEGPRKGQVALPDVEDGKSRWLLPSGAIEVFNPTTGESIFKRPEGPLEVTYSSNGVEVKEEFDTVLLAIARTANVKGFGLDKAGVRILNDKILVDAFEQTTAPHIFALGDVATGIDSHGFKVGTRVIAATGAKKGNGVISAVAGGKFAVTVEDPEGKQTKITNLDAEALEYRPTDRPELTPVAIRAGQFLVRRLFGTRKEPMDYSLVPTTVFTSPEYGVVGLSQEEAQCSPAEGGIGKVNVEVFHSRFGPIETTCGHPHVTPVRSTLLHGKNLWARRYAEDRNLYWDDTGFDEDDYSHVVYTDGKKYNNTKATVKGRNEKDGKITYNISINGTDEVIENVLPSTLELTGESYKFRAERYLKAPCLAKLVVDKRNDKIIGFHFVGPHAGEVTQGFALALKCGATKQQFDDLVGIHPTAAEEFATLELTREGNVNFLKKEGCGGGTC